MLIAEARQRVQSMASRSKEMVHVEPGIDENMIRPPFITTSTDLNEPRSHHQLTRLRSLVQQVCGWSGRAEVSDVVPEVGEAATLVDALPQPWVLAGAMLLPPPRLIKHRPRTIPCK